MFVHAYVGDVKSFLEAEFSWMDITAAQTGPAPTTSVILIGICLSSSGHSPFLVAMLFRIATSRELGMRYPCPVPVSLPLF